MKRKNFLTLLIFSLILFSSCGSKNDQAFITLIVSTNSGDIGNIVYLDGDGTEHSINGATGKRIWTTSFPAQNGDFIYLSAQSVDVGSTVTINAKVLSNNIEISSGSATGKNATGSSPATPATIDIEAFAQSEPKTSTEGNEGEAGGATGS